MKQSVIKIATLNLWRFNDWQKRISAIVTLVNKLSPDVVLLQEVQKDISFGEENQVDILNKILKYKYSNFSEACIKTTRKGNPLPHPISHGLGILSKLPFNSDIIKLDLAENDTEPRIVVKNNFIINGNPLSITNVHFANSDAWAELHLKQTLALFNDHKNINILAGDFNVKNLDGYKKLYEKDYISSKETSNYISYPKDNVSYDYMLIPKKFSFTSFQCREEIVSDHKLLFAEIRVS